MEASTLNKAGHIWIEVQLFQQGTAEFQSMYGQTGCTEVNLHNLHFLIWKQMFLYCV